MLCVWRKVKSCFIPGRKLIDVSSTAIGWFKFQSMECWFVVEICAVLCCGQIILEYWTLINYRHNYKWNINEPVSFYLFAAESYK